MGRPTSDNGWPVIYPDETSKRYTLHVPGVDAPFVVARGTERLWREFITWFDRNVEKINEFGWDGGYAFRKTRGSDTSWSTHSSGTGGDINAAQHPLGRERTFSPDQERKIREWLRTPVGQAFKWGGNFTSRPDEMHFQLRTRGEVDAALAYLARQDRKPEPKPEPVRPQPVRPAPEEVNDMLLLYVKREDPAKHAYAVLPGGLRRFSGTEVAQIRQQGGKVVFLTVSSTDVVFKLPLL